MSETPAAPTLAPGEPTPVVGLTFDSFAECFENSTSWLSKSQVFISTDAVLPIGSPVAVDISVVDGTPLVRAFGRVSWVRKQRMRDDQPAGLGIGIIHLDAASAALIDAVDRCKQGNALGSEYEPADDEAATTEIPVADDQVADDQVADDELDVDADVALALDRMEAISPAPIVPQETNDHRAAGSTAVTASAMFADGLHFGEESGSGADPAISSGRELDEFAEVSFSDVENAVSREIDAAVLRHGLDIRARGRSHQAPPGESGLSDGSDLEGVPETPADAGHPAGVEGSVAPESAEDYDPDVDYLEDDFDEESEILAPLELALVEVDRTPPEALATEATPTEEAGDPGASRDHDTLAVATPYAEEDTRAISGGISTATISTVDLARAAEADEASFAETDDEPSSRTISTAIISRDDLEAATRNEHVSPEAADPSEAITSELAIELDREAETHDTAPVAAVHDDELSDAVDLTALLDDSTISVPPARADTASVPIEAGDEQDETLAAGGSRSGEYSSISDSVEVSADEMAAHLLAASTPTEEETADTQPTVVPEEDVIAADDSVSVNSVEDEGVGDPRAASEADDAAGHPQPGYDPWDLDVSSFIDDALQERAAIERAARTEVMPPADLVPQTAVAPIETTTADADALVANATTAGIAGTHASEDSTITVMPRTAKEEDETVGFGPPKTPVPPPDPFHHESAPEPPVMVTPPPSEHPEAQGVRTDGQVDDKTLSFQKQDQLAAPGPDEAPSVQAEEAVEVTGAPAGQVTPPNAPSVASMDQEPDFGTMAAELELPPALEASPAPRAEDTASITLPTDQLRAAVAAADAFPAETRLPEPSAFEETAKLPPVTLPPRGPLDASPRATAPPTRVPRPQAGPSASEKRSGYYARAGAKSRQRKSTGLGLLAAAFCVAALGLALMRTGTVDKISTWARTTFRAAPGPSAARDTSPVGAPTEPAGGTRATASPTTTGSPSTDGPGRASDSPAAIDPTATLSPDAGSGSTTLDATAAATSTETSLPPVAGQTVDAGDGNTEDSNPEDSSPSISDTRGQVTATADMGGTPSSAAGANTAQDPATARRNVRAAVEGWAAAWTRQDPDAYLAFYDSTFEIPEGLGRAGWEDQRRARLRAPRSLTVQTSELDVERLDGNQATVRFFQSYRAKGANGTRNLGTWKRFELVRRTDGWRIVRESLVR